MSDFDRNATTAEYGRPLTRAEAAVVDAGLRAYMLRVYNYMVIGLAITGFAALGAYMLSVTGDAASAAKVLRGGAWATGPIACSTTFRNWDLPIRRQIFAGFRCASDA